MDWIFFGVIIFFLSLILHLNGVLIERNGEIECLNEKIKMLESHNKSLVQALRG